MVRMWYTRFRQRLTIQIHTVFVKIRLFFESKHLVGSKAQPFTLSNGVLLKCSVQTIVYISAPSVKSSHTLLSFKIVNQNPQFFWEHKRHISNFLVLYNTLGFYAIKKFEGPQFVLIFKLFNYYIYIFQFQLSSCSFLHNKGLKTKDYTIQAFVESKFGSHLGLQKNDHFNHFFGVME